MKRSLIALVALGATLSGAVSSAASAEVKRPQQGQAGSHISAKWSTDQSGFGMATGPERAISADGETGWIQTFRNSNGTLTDIVSSSHGSFAVRASYQKSYGANPSVYGWPTSDWYRVSNNGTGTVQTFTKSLLTTRTGGSGNVWVKGAMYNRYVSQGRLSSLGWPTGNETFLGRCGEYVQNYTVGRTLYQDSRFCPASNFAQPETSTPSNGSGYNLGSGYNGNAVFLAQKALGINSSVMSTTVGPTTSTAIRNFQSRRGLPVTGVIDRTTWNALGTGFDFNTSSWVQPSRVATNATASQRRQAMVDFATSMLGRPYLWGGTGNPGYSYGYDCSGFALQAIRAAGVNPSNVSNWYDVYPTSDLSDKLWRDSEFQTVSTSNLIPGDLVFYGDSNKVHHVSIYVGDGMAIQEVGTRAQKLSVWNTSGWPYIYGAKRPIASSGATSNGTTMTGYNGTMQGVGAVEGKKAVSGVTAPSLMIDGNAFAPKSVSVSNNKVAASSSDLSSGVVAPVKDGQKVSVPTSGDSETVFIGDGRVLGISKGGSVTVPKGADKALVISTAKAPSVKVDSEVDALR